MKKLILLLFAAILLAGCVAGTPVQDPCDVNPYTCPGGINGR